MCRIQGIPTVAITIPRKKERPNSQRTLHRNRSPSFRSKQCMYIKYYTIHVLYSARTMVKRVSSTLVVENNSWALVTMTKKMTELSGSDVTRSETGRGKLRFQQGLLWKNERSLLIFGSPLISIEGYLDRSGTLSSKSTELSCWELTPYLSIFCARVKAKERASLVY